MKAAGSEANMELQQQLSELLSQKEVELHAAKLAIDRFAAGQAAQQQELAHLRQELANVR